MSNTADILFEYLRDILYSPNKACLDISKLPDDYQKLGKGLEFLADCMKEQRNFVEAIANGYISVEPPSSENVVASPLKELQSIMLHLTWLIQQIANGDYSQRFPSSGEFADAFNEMVGQLDERTKELLAEKKLVEQKNRELQRSAQFMQILANDTHNMIMVFNKNTGELVYSNNAAQQLEKNSSLVHRMLKNKLINHRMENLAESDRWDIQITPGGGKEKMFYIIESFCGTQEEDVMVIHMITDDTERKKLENLTYTDGLTGLHNKIYALNQMEEHIAKEEPFLLSFVDVDYLKYCNDTFGHEAGDEYLIRVSEMLSTLECTVCRIGGDEFLLVKPGSDKTALDYALFTMREELKNTGGEKYPKSFSFGTCSIPANPAMSLSDYLKLADDTMYKFKTKYKKPLEDVTYKDDRI